MEGRRPALISSSMWMMRSGRVDIRARGAFLTEAMLEPLEHVLDLGHEVGFAPGTMCG